MLSATIFCLALNIFHEARGEALVGRLEVAKVTLNRAYLRNTSVCHEVKRPSQFSWYKPGSKLKAPVKEPKAWRRSIDEAKRAVQMHVFNKNGLTHYHKNTVLPNWATKLDSVKVVGSHVFYRESNVKWNRKRMEGKILTASLEQSKSRCFSPICSSFLQNRRQDPVYPRVSMDGNYRPRLGW